MLYSGFNLLCLIQAEEETCSCIKNKGKTTSDLHFSFCFLFLYSAVLFHLWLASFIPSNIGQAQLVQNWLHFKNMLCCKQKSIPTLETSNWVLVNIDQLMFLVCKISIFGPTLWYQIIRHSCFPVGVLVLRQ